MVEPTHLKNIRQIGNLPQGSEVNIKKMKSPPSLGVQKFITWICFVIKCLPFLVKLWKSNGNPLPHLLQQRLSNRPRRRHRRAGGRRSARDRHRRTRHRRTRRGGSAVEAAPWGASIQGQGKTRWQGGAHGDFKPRGEKVVVVL